MEVRPGYKQTEVGVIPVDWVVKTVGEISEVKTGPFGSALHEKDYVNDGTPIITVEHLGEQGVLHRNIPMVSDADKTRLKAYSLRKGDIVFSRVGSVDRNALIKGDEEGWLFSGRLLRVRLNEKDIDSKYLSYHFHSEAFKQRVRDVAVGQTMASINTQILMSVNTNLPPNLAEQQAIAEALSDADVLIESLEQLIAKKRQIKQGAMQELLIGKRRLPGYNSEWKVAQFVDIVQPRKERIDHRHSGEQSFCIELEHIEQGTGKLTGYTATAEGSSIKSVFRKGDVLFGKLRAYLRKYWLADRDGVCSTEIWVFIANRSRLIPEFLFQLVRMDGFIETASNAYGTHMPRSDWQVVKNYLTYLPALVEQAAITNILTDMDAEIIALEQKLVKTRLLKQGMMQELLTGRIRLVSEP